MGDLATQFAVEMGFQEESLSTAASKQVWLDWRKNNCQPNFWVDVTPDANSHCGPYEPQHPNDIFFRDFKKEHHSRGSEGNHDTIGMVAIDEKGQMVAGTSTNGLKFKVAGYTTKARSHFSLNNFWIMIGESEIHLFLELEPMLTALLAEQQPLEMGMLC